ncbi:MAG: 1-(5-phosphoribosyl)-5-[Clostridia bacterium]|nr:1-(5-phosphoribosyl)-5-[(5-phosphoribosylamino)methylideneamino]imidazole-4-carboxamide isomerase [Oscillospiraceae bacterium]MBQ7960831.1 1-(5-phosphoribosyl)-5-[(5-phosphoribosylamino)methylideneamino]imidazole-4-carboxamide isomerase [Clostridia bacterium]
MYIFPAIDLYEGKAVRLLRGEYDKMTIYSENPIEIAYEFQKAGASHIHMVDLEGAKTGGTPNLDIVKEVAEKTDLFVEIGGGIRSMDVIDAYIGSGIDRVILGTAAVQDKAFVKAAVDKYSEKIAVGADIKDGYVAIKGWTEKSEYTCFDFCEEMQKLGVRTLICTDVSKDGAMQGTNRELYKELSEKFNMQIVASGGVSSIDDVKALAAMNLYGAIIGKAYYTKAISLEEAIEVAE